MCTKTVGSRPAQLVSFSKTENAFHPTTPWMPVSDVDAAIVFNMSTQGKQGGFQAAPAYQLTDVRPDSNLEPPVMVGALVNSNQFAFRSIPGTSLNLTKKMFWRFGLLYNGGDSSGPGSFGQAEAQLQVSYHEIGRILGKQTIEYQPTSDGTGSVAHVSVFPCTKWESIVGAAAVKAAFTISSTRNTIKAQLHVRYANDPNLASSWIAIGPSFSTSGNGQNPPTSVALNPMDNARFQLGVGLSDGSSGGSAAEARATVNVLTAALG